MGGSLIVIAATLIIIALARVQWKISMLGPKNAILVIVTFVGLFLVGTDTKSPVAVVPRADAAYVNVKDQVSQSQWAADMAEVLGQNPELYGLTAAKDAESPAASLTVQQQSAAPDVAQIAAPVQTAPTQDRPPANITFAASTVAFAEGNADVCGLAASSDGTNWLYNIAILCDDSDQPSPATRPLGNATIPGVSIPAPVVIAQPTQPAPSPAAAAPEPATYDPEELLKLQRQCWLTWAGKNQLQSTTTEWGSNALPAGTIWTLTGPGFLGAGLPWQTKSKEKWLLNSIDLGITDYQITGFLARSFPGAERSASVVVYGSNILLCQP